MPTAAALDLVGEGAHDDVAPPLTLRKGTASAAECIEVAHLWICTP